MAFTPLNALSAFVAVARRRSFAAAAAELGVSPSALSQAVRQLEARLGVVLLTRTTRSVALSEAGRRLFEQAAPALQQALTALKGASAASGELTGRVRLTVPEIAVPFVVTPLVPRYVRQHPGVELEVQVEDRRVDIVADGFDAGVRLEEFIERDMVQLRLTEPFRFVVVAAPAYLKRRGVPMTPRELIGHDCICYRSATTGSLYAWELERGRQTFRVPVRGSFISNHWPSMLAMTEAGLGLTYAMEPLVAPLIKRKLLQLVLEPFAARVPGFFLYFPSRAQVSPAFRAFLDVARDVLRSPRLARREGERE